MTIGKGDTAPVILNCFAHCDPEDVLTALGLEWKDLYPDPWDCAARRSNEAAREYAKRTFRQFDPLEIEQRVLVIAADYTRAGKPLSVEDVARIEVARERLAVEVTHG